MPVTNNQEALTLIKDIQMQDILSGNGLTFDEAKRLLSGGVENEKLASTAWR